MKGEDENKEQSKQNPKSAEFWATEEPFVYNTYLSVPKKTVSKEEDSVSGIMLSNYLRTKMSPLYFGGSMSDHDQDSEQSTPGKGLFNWNAAIPKFANLHSYMLNGNNGILGINSIIGGNIIRLSESISYLSDLVSIDKEDTSTKGNITTQKDEISIENLINKKREEYLNEKITPQLITMIKEEDFEFGYTSRSEKLIKEQLDSNALATRNWLNDIFIRNFGNELIVMGVLRILGRFDSSIIFPQGQTIALSALTHKNDEIKELGIRAFENWCSVESVNILQNIKFDKAWLQDYVDEVIKDHEEQLCLC